MTLPTVGVASFPRGGTSMTMRILEAGGIPPVEGTYRDSYELPTLEAIAAADPQALAGRSIKLLDTFLHMPTLETAASWKLIWLDRDPIEQAKSMFKFLSAVAPSTVRGVDQHKVERKLERSFRDDRIRALSRLRAAGPTLVLQFESILAEPHGAAVVLREFLAPEFDFADLPAHVVVLDRGPECQPDLAIEGFTR